ncbi:FAD-binding oxidoreductase [Halorhodospira halochloris]|uniref:FAD-binding oxidoreductase n=1 Tax=Halorhodospira halochloris TaxID=1052 RepID=UPI001EE95DA4|nr:FAD-binding oxidoreductase [Halorhodospira halochloris]
MSTYRIRLADGSSFTAEQGETVLDAALRQGKHLPYGCRDGVCGSCELQVSKGSVEYPDGLPQALTSEEQRSGLAIMCQALPQSDLSLDWSPDPGVLPPEPRQLAARVTDIDFVSADVCRLLLQLPEGKRLPFWAGQYIDILLQDGARRSFSLANSPHNDERLELHIRRVPGGRFTEYVFEHLRIGSWLRFEGPLGQFYLRENSSRPVILVAGGTGFAPIKSIIEYAMAASIDRSFEIYWGAGSVQGIYMDQQVRNWLSKTSGNKGPRLSYTPVVADGGAEGGWQGREGMVHEAVLADHPDLSDYEAYVAGPPPMVDAAEREFIRHGLDPQRLFYDSFEISAGN